MKGKVCALFAAALLAACGGGGSDDGSSSDGGNNNGGGGNAAGHLLYAELGKAVWYDLGNGGLTQVALPADSLGYLGFGGGLVTEVEDIPASGASNEQFIVHLHSAGSSSLPSAGDLPVISSLGLRVSGPVQPSTDGSLFAVHTRESTLDDPTVTDHVYIIDRQGTVKLHGEGYVDPVWLSADTIVAAFGDTLFKLQVGNGTAQRIGPSGAGASGQNIGRLSVSPDGHSIAFTQAGLLWRIGTDGTGLMQLTSSFQDLQWSAWSPDGSRIAVQVGECGVLGTGTGDSRMTILSSTAANQNVGGASLLMAPGNVPAQSCGPLYWRP